MPQIFWKYENTSGKDYEVSLYHGDTSGHVLLYSGQEIIKIDFNVRSERHYGFMLGDELFEVSVKGTQTLFKYQLFNVAKAKIIPPFDVRNYPTYHILKAIIFLMVVVLSLVLIWQFLKM